MELIITEDLLIDFANYAKSLISPKSTVDAWKEYKFSKLQGLKNYKDELLYLFTTEDGFKKYLGDQCFYVDLFREPVTLKCLEITKEVLGINNYKFFHSLEECNKFISKNISQFLNLD